MMVDTIFVTSDGVLCWGESCVRCTLGRSGIREEKEEGDGCTCAGSYVFRCIFFRSDRVELPIVHLPVRELDERDGWCDDPDDLRYNQYVRLPYSGRHECLWREDGLYDVIVVIGYNDDPVCVGRGSAIFLHIAHPDGSATEGCIGVSREDMLELVTHIYPHTVLHIQAAQVATDE